MRTIATLLLSTSIPDQRHHHYQPEVRRLPARLIIQNQPNRIFAPGTIPAYPNYGVGLASYIVQRVSGEPFEKYTKEHIYTPLKMTHSTFYQPLPKSLTASEGYAPDTTKPVIGHPGLVL